MDALFSSLATQTLTPDLLPSPPPLSLLPLLLQLATTTPPSLLRDRLEEVTLSEPSCSAVKAYMEHCASLRIDLEKKEVALEEELRSAVSTSPHIVRTLLDIYVTIITTYGLGSGSSAGSGSLHVDSITIVVKSLADTVKTAPKVDPTQRGLLLDFLLTLLCTVAACYPPIGGGGYNSINSEVVSGVADGIFSVTTMRSIISTHSDVGTAVGVGVAVMATNGALLEEIVHSVITRRVNVSGWGAVVRWLNFSAKKIGYEFEEVFERAEGRRIWFPGASVMQAKYLRRRGLQRLFVEAIEANVSSTSLLSALSPSCSSSSPSPPSSPIDSWSLTDFVDVAEGAVNEIILEWKEHKTLSTPVVWGDAVATAIERWGERSCKYNKAILLQLHYALQYCKKMRGRGGTTVFCVDPAALQLGAIFDEVEEFWPEYAKTFFQLCKDVGRASPTPAAATAKRWEIALLEYEKKQVIASPIPLLQNSRVTPRQISHAILACLWGAVATDSCTLVMNLFRAARAATTEPAAIDCAAVNAIIGQKRDGVNLRFALTKTAISCDPLILLRASAADVWGKKGLLSMWLFLLETFLAVNLLEVERRVSPCGAVYGMTRDVIIIKTLLAGCVKYSIFADERSQIDRLITTILTRSEGLFKNLLIRIDESEAKVLFKGGARCSDGNAQVVVDLVENNSYNNSFSNLTLKQLLFVVTCGLRIAVAGGGGQKQTQRLGEMACNVLYNSVEELVVGGAGKKEDEEARVASSTLLEFMCGESMLRAGREMWSMVVRALARVVQSCGALRAVYGDNSEEVVGMTSNDARVCVAMINKMEEKVKVTMRALGVQV